MQRARKRMRKQCLVQSLLKLRKKTEKRLNRVGFLSGLTTPQQTPKFSQWGFFVRIKAMLITRFGKRIAVASLIALGFLVFAPTGEIQAQLTSERRAELEKELADIEKQIASQKVILDGKQRERVSLERDVDILNAEIKQAQLSIKARNLVIQRLTSDIGSKSKTIGELGDKLNREKDALAEIVRRTHAMDSFSIAEVALSREDLSDFFLDVDSFQAIKSSLHQSYESVSQNKKETEDVKATLEDKKADEVELKLIQELQKKRVEEKELEKKKLLADTKGQEKAYQAILADKEKSAASIRTALFSLRNSAAIPFERAYEYAKVASAKTGVRPALILGIIAEESNLGENVGTGTWRVDMKAPRDTEPFLDITRRLGLDPDKMPVSKNPWYADDAFMATGLLMMDNGADKGIRAAERLAALRYFAGWTNATKPSYAFYGDDVMALADKYQKLVDIIK